MGLDSLSLTSTINLNWTATKNVAGLQPNTNSQSANKNYAYTSGASATSALGCNEFFASLFTIPSASTVTLDLTAFTDIMGVAATSFARVKFWSMRLLGTADTAPDGTTVGTTATKITIGNAATNIFPFNFGIASNTVSVDNAGCWSQQMGSTQGITVAAARSAVQIVNNDTNTSAQVLVFFAGNTA